jgi:hypothetical protein
VYDEHAIGLNLLFLHTFLYLSQSFQARLFRNVRSLRFPHVAAPHFNRFHGLVLLGFPPSLLHRRNLRRPDFRKLGIFHFGLGHGVVFRRFDGRNGSEPLAFGGILGVLSGALLGFAG